MNTPPSRRIDSSHEEVRAARLETPHGVGRLDLHDDVAGKLGVELLVGVLRGVQENRIYPTSGLLYALDTEIEVHRRRVLKRSCA
jgi:hypothetical protein